MMAKKKVMNKKVVQPPMQPVQKGFRLNESEARLVLDSLSRDKDVELAERTNIGNAKLNILAELQNALQGKTQQKPKPAPRDEFEEDEDYDPESASDEEAEYEEEYEDGDFGGAV